MTASPRKTSRFRWGCLWSFPTRPTVYPAGLCPGVTTQNVSSLHGSVDSCRPKNALVILGKKSAQQLLVGTTHLRVIEDYADEVQELTRCFDHRITKKTMELSHSLVPRRGESSLVFSANCVPDTSCWFVGYPADREGRKPLVTKARIAHGEGPEWSHMLHTGAAIIAVGGDSGGGVFDLSGRLLAIHQGWEPGRPGRHPRVETLRAQWDSLTQKSK